MTVHARIQRGLHILRKSVGRYCDDGDFFCVRAFRLHGADGSCRLKSVHFWHHNVHQNDDPSCPRFFQAVVDFGYRILMQCDIGKADDGIHRGTDIVGHIGEEHTFCFAGGLRRVCL